MESAPVPSPAARAAAEAVGGVGTKTNMTPTNDDAAGNVPQGDRTSNSSAPTVRILVRFRRAGYQIEAEEQPDASAKPDVA